MNAQPEQVTPSVYINFSAEINPTTTETLLAAMGQCANQRAEEVHLLLSTPGGSVMHGMNLYNVLRAMPFTLITHNVGNVDSIGNAVFLAGKRRYACQHSTFMFHGVGFDINGGVRLEEKGLREHLAGVNADQRRIGAIIQEHTNISGEDVSALFLEATTKDAQYAVDMGIVHEVRDVNIPTGSSVMSLVFQR